MVYPDLSGSMKEIDALYLTKIAVNHNGSVICSLGFDTNNDQSIQVGQRKPNEFVDISKDNPVN